MQEEEQNRSSISKVQNWSDDVEAETSFTNRTPEGDAAQERLGDGRLVNLWLHFMLSANKFNNNRAMLPVWEDFVRTEELSSSLAIQSLNWKNSKVLAFF